jgi:UDP-glucose 6-dehydrogenase
MKTIGIIGRGMVGNAVATFYEARGFRVLVYDRLTKKTNCAFDALVACDIIYVCVPTPTIDGKQDLSSVEHVMTELGEVANKAWKGGWFPGDQGWPVRIVIKSTVLPGTCDKLASHFGFGSRLIFMPEFLTARTAVEDFEKPTDIVIGFDPFVDQPFVEHVLGLWPGVKLTLCSRSEAETIKYGRNCFYAVKVCYMNELARMCRTLGLDWGVVRRGLLASG